ncbi:16S rRNA (uracil(1498)-N(3))-methyltransferase [Limimonas halophila]|uniref:16S rRNA (uracil(1498)-N(3))-methyltransferase n=1 Tax=Limimonas halophila TaxID=1082479 RepID=UPI001FDF2867|nr:16S rRNA (uracil(1498)-N(3))-methyltransferase [Limimonas halophila]
MSERAATRLHVTEPLAAGGVVGLDHQGAHYLRSVLRLNRGDHVALFNGADGEWLARIEGLGKGWASLAVVELRRPQAPEPDVWLVFAPIKRARLDFMVEKATELGVSVLQPVWTQHTDVTRVNTERLAANAREAAEQCERLTVPAVREPERLTDLLDGWPATRRALLCAETGAAQPVADALSGLAAEGAGDAPWAVMTGPEGGFHAGELDALRRLPFVTPVGLGPRVLRTDTAALAALACWQAWLGDGRQRPPDRGA